jgi:DNA-binding beta-propeller fold protein YncE
MRTRVLFPRAAVPAILLGALSLGAAVALAASTFQAANMFFGSPTVTEGPVNSFDISWVDPRQHQYYLADRSNKDIDIFDTATNLWVDRVTGFKGFTGNNDTSGPNGVIVTRSGKELYVGDGDSKTQVVDLERLTIAATIVTGGANRADELGFSPQSHLVLVANDAESDAAGKPCPFLSFISTTSRTVVAQVIYDGGLAASGSPCGLASVPKTHTSYVATDGLEQPLWDREEAKFFQAVPASSTNPGGQIDELDPSSHTVVKSFPVGSASNPCHPQGLVLGADGRIWTGCNPGRETPGVPRVIAINPDTGAQTVVNLLPAGSGGPDQIWFNKGDHRLYAAASTPARLGVVETDSNTLVELVPTATGSHSVAADARRNHIFVPENAAGCPANGCVAVFESGGTPRDVGDDGDAD